MSFWQAINGDPGYSIDSLSAGELARLRELITGRYLGRLEELAPATVQQFRSAGIDNYHSFDLPFDHGSSWPKPSRLLPAEMLPELMGMGFFQRVRSVLPSAEIVPYDTMWRIVRPNQPDDVGPVHADKWFWDAGNGSMPPGYERFKIWVAVYTEPGANGLCVKPLSHLSDRWKHHFEHKHGVMKPVLDESPEDLKMELLPLAPGQLVLFHDALLHGGALNRGTTCRVSIELTVIYDAAEGRRVLESGRLSKKAG